MEDTKLTQHRISSIHAAAAAAVAAASELASWRGEGARTEVSRRERGLVEGGVVLTPRRRDRDRITDSQE